MTGDQKPTYSRCQNVQNNLIIMNPEKRKSLELATLEQKIDELIETVEKLSSENKQLKTESNQLASDRLSLLEKTEQARTRVEAMISRLKGMETR